MLLHSPKAHSRAGHPCVDDRRQNRAGPASLAARVDDMRKNGNAEKRPTLFQCRRSTLGTRDGGDAHARIWRAVARAARRVARNSGGRPSGRDRQINRSHQSQPCAGSRCAPLRSFAESTCAWQHIRTRPHSRTQLLELRAVSVGVRVPRMALRQHRGRRRWLVGH